MKAHVETITNLLLGAAYADKRLQGGEVDKIRSLLLKLLGTDQLPSAQSQQIATFSPARFSLDGATASLKALGVEDRRLVLEMVAAVHESDDEIDFAEDEYLRRVARGLGFSDSEIEDLTIQVEVEELEGSLG